MEDPRSEPMAAPIDSRLVTAPLSRAEFTRRVWVVVGIVAFTAAAGVLLVRAADIVFLFFAAILLAILLRSASDLSSRWTKLGSNWSLGLVVLFVVVVLVGAAIVFGATVVGQINHMAIDLPKSADQIRAHVRRFPWGDDALRRVPAAENLLMGSAGGIGSRAVAFFTTTFGVLGNILVLTVTSLYLAATPRMYLRGVLSLVPPRRRDRAEQVLNAIGVHLKWWLVGRLAAIVAVGLVIGVGLRLAGVPQFLVLALVAAGLSSIPFLGPILGAIPGLLLALVQGPATVGWAIVVYSIAQAVENHLVTPLVQQRLVSMSPVVTIASVVLIGSLFGVLGLIVATPLAVALQVTVKMLYVEDILGESVSVPRSSKST